MRRRAIAIMLAWLVALGPPPAGARLWAAPAAQVATPDGAERIVRTTEHFRIEAPPAFAAPVEHFARFADLLLGSIAGALEVEIEPEAMLLLRLWPEDAAAQGIDPYSRPIEGILIPRLQPRREIDLRLPGPDLAPASPEQLSNALRLPLAAQLLDQAAGGRLPVGFQLGGARYFQAPDTQIQGLVAELRGADLGQPPSWHLLNRAGAEFQEPVRFQAWSLSVVHFLFVRGGLSGFNRFLAELRDGSGWRAALGEGYNADPAALEAEWRAGLPAYVNGGWQDHRLYRGGVEHARRLLAAGDFRAAAAQLRASLSFQQPDGSDQGELDRQLLDRALAATRGRADLELALELLESGAYPSAEAAARAAEPALAVVNDAAGAGRAVEIARRARLGQGAAQRLADARNMRGWRAVPAAALARAAAADLSRLGDVAGAAEAGALALRLSRAPRQLGAVLCLLGSLLLGLNVQRRRRAPRAGWP